MAKASVASEALRALMVGRVVDIEWDGEPDCLATGVVLVYDTGCRVRVTASRAPGLPDSEPPIIEVSPL